MIDTDFADIDAVFKHLKDRYGELSVARVGAYTRFTAKSATIKVLSAYGFSQKDIKALTDKMPDRLSFTLDEAIKESKEVRNFFKEHSGLERIIRKFEGIVEHLSTHAGGVIICEELVRLLPIIKRSEDLEKMVIAMDKKELEELGHYKFDILGLSYLSIMKNFNSFVDIDWQDVDFEDPDVYEMLQSGSVTGVFQLADQKDKTMQMKPSCFEDLIAINALIRPGVCDWNEYMDKRFNPSNETTELEDLPFMRSTHGLIVYQEQYLLLAQLYAGWGIAYADKHIRKNKNIYGDTKLREKWMEDTGGMSDLWDTICGIVAGGYSFNKSHATSYARLTFMTAYAKCHYPKEFYAAYLNQYLNKPERLTEAISELKSLGIKLLHPDINESQTTFIPTKDGILFPITSVKGVGGSALYAIEKLKPIQSFQDFLDRRIPKFVKKTTIEALVKSGAFDGDGKTRYELLCQWKDTFKEEGEKPNYAYEFEAFGFYLHDTPFDRYKIKPWKEFESDSFAMTIGKVIELKLRVDKRGAEMAFVKIINSTDTIDLVIFSSVWKTLGFEEGDMVFFKGKKDGDKMLVNSAEVLEHAN